MVRWKCIALLTVLSISDAGSFNANFFQKSKLASYLPQRITYGRRDQQNYIVQGQDLAQDEETEYTDDYDHLGLEDLDEDTVNYLSSQLGGTIGPLAASTSASACSIVSEIYVKNILRLPWALKMFDATGKIPEGILQGNLYPLGSWDECLNIAASVNSTSDTGEIHFQGRYCLASIAPSDEDSDIPATTGSEDTDNWPIPGISAVSAMVGICIPSACTAADLAGALNFSLGEQFHVTVPDFACHVKDEQVEFSSADIAVLAILAITALFMLAGTVVDVVTDRTMGDGSFWPSHNHQSTTMSDHLYSFLKAFSIRTNGRKLLDTSSSGDTLACLHGIRFISMSWVILGHTYAFISAGKNKNILHVLSYTNDLAFNAISNSTVSVDSFFFLSGLLVCYIFMRNMHRSGGRFNLARFYVHRYIRLTPALMMVIAFVATLYAHLGSGPNWGSLYGERSNYMACRQDWWKNMLYVNNLVPESACLGQTWYLANDMQMYVFSPLVLLPLYYWPVLGQVWIIVLVCFFTGINAMLTVQNNLGPTIQPVPGGGEPFTTRYIKPWARAGPYLVGLYTGWLLHKIHGRKIALPAPVVVIGWTTAALTACMILYGMSDYLRATDPATPSQLTNVVYPMLSRTAWSLCVAWVVFACVTGHGYFVNTLLSWSPLVPLSRLTYTAYLTSMDIQFFYWYTSKSAVYLDHTFIVLQFLAHLPIIAVISAMFSLAFESPVLALEKLIFPSLRAPPVRVQAQQAPLKAFDDTEMTSRESHTNYGFDCEQASSRTISNEAAILQQQELSITTSMHCTSGATRITHDALQSQEAVL